MNEVSGDRIGLFQDESKGVPTTTELPQTVRHSKTEWATVSFPT